MKNKKDVTAGVIIHLVCLLIIFFGSLWLIKTLYEADIFKDIIQKVIDANLLLHSLFVFSLLLSYVILSISDGRNTRRKHESKN